MTPEQHIRSNLDGNFWKLCNITGSITCTKVPNNYIPDHSGYDYSEAGRRARRNSTLTHRNPKRNLEGSEFETVKKLAAIHTNREDIHFAMRQRGSKASARAVYEAVRRIRGKNG